jgi:transposase
MTRIVINNQKEIHINNRYLKKAKISEKKFLEIVKLFSIDLNASQISEISGISRNTVNRYLKAIREKIASYCEAESPFPRFTKLNEKIIAGKQESDDKADSKDDLIAGIFSRNGRIYTEIVPLNLSKLLQRVIKGRITLDTIIHTIDWRGYNGLIDFSVSKLYKVKGLTNESGSGNLQINSIDSFWGVTKTRLSKFRGISRSTFNLHLKECEFRFNYRDSDISKIIPDILLHQPGTCHDPKL